MFKAKNKIFKKSMFLTRYPVRKILAFFALTNLGLCAFGLIHFFFLRTNNIQILREEDLFANIDHFIATKDSDSKYFPFIKPRVETTINGSGAVNPLVVSDISKIEYTPQGKKIRQILGAGKINAYFRNSKLEMASLVNKNGKAVRNIFRYGNGFYDHTGKRQDNVHVMTKPLALIKPSGPKKVRISSPYGMRVHPILKTHKFHAGVDIAADKNSLILCALPGRVKLTAYNRFYGTYVIVEHLQGIETLYAHLDSIDAKIKIGARVEQNAVIGKMGRTGRATAPHLHFETRINGKHTNPASIKPIYETISPKSAKEFQAHVKTLLTEVNLLENMKISESR